MIDREKVVNGLRNCLHYNGSCLDCPYDGPNCQNDVLDDALELLKEQQEIVRCKDCRYWDSEEHTCNIKIGWFACDADWFCADGEKK